MTYLDSTLGAAFIGNVIASSLYGIACTEEYAYFFKRRTNDPVYLRLLLILVWLSDTVQIAFSTHALYYYMVINYDNTLALLYPTWSLLSQIFATSISGLIVRGIFTKRVFMVTNRNYGVLGIIGLASLSAFGEWYNVLFSYMPYDFASLRFR
ncbi:hypothetical protein APHAL10511_005004 [Amanita phalloides]|nr:hypothetical protein APHAL10511_005004 [Amanita phalloides]